MELQIFLVVIMTINGQDFERREMMLDAPTCFARAAEKWVEVVKLHPEATGVGIGCAMQNGDPV